MAKTVTSAFDEFLRDKVNLDSEETKTARASRDWLVDQIHAFPKDDNDFLRLYSEMDIFFGSFARRTKKRELDDIDIMIALHAEGGSYIEYTDNHIEIFVLDTADRLKKLCFDDTKTLNSRKVINRFLSALSDVPQYEKAETHRNMEAATLKLKSYTWNFDTVPCFFTKPDLLGRTYYLIPDGKGYWKKTDPRMDRERVINVNKNNDNNILNVIRIMKYWNTRPTMPSMSSYLIENMILDFYEFASLSKASKYVDLEIPKVLNYVKDNVFNVVGDPKKIQGNINNLTPDEKVKIYVRASLDYDKSLKAKELEQNGKHEESIKKWAEIFGTEFPPYG